MNEFLAAHNAAPTVGDGEEESRALLEWYRSSFDAIDRSRRVELLGRFARLGIIGPEETRGYAERMSAAERAAFGEYLGNAMKGTAFVRVFHACWNDLSDDLRAAFVLRFTKEEPARLVMVAPFVDVTSLQNWETHVKTFDRFAELLAAVLAYEPSGPHALTQRSSAEILVSWIKSKGFSSLRIHLLPHATTLMDRGWMTRDELAGILKGTYNYFSPEMRAEGEKKNSSRDPITGYVVISAEDRLVKARISELLSNGFLAVGDASSTSDFLQHLAEQSVSWVDAAQRIGATADDIVKLVRLTGRPESDIFSDRNVQMDDLLRYAKQAFANEFPRIENAMLEAIQENAISSGGSLSDMAIMFVRRYKEIFPFLSAEGTRHGLALIAGRQPGLLLLSSEAMADAQTQGMPFDPRSALDTALRSDPIFFLSNFDAMWENARAASDMTIADVGQMVAREIRRNPKILFREEAARGLREIVPDSERVSIVTDLLRTHETDGPFLIDVIGDSMFASLHDTARNLLAQPDALDSVVEFPTHLIVNALGGFDRLIQAAFASSDLQTADELSGRAIEYFGENPAVASRWIRHLEQIGAVKAVVSIGEQAGYHKTPGIFPLLTETLVRMGARDPRGLFTKYALRVLGDEAGPFLRENADLSIRCNPNLITETREGSSDAFLYEWALGPRGFDDLLKRNIHALSFSPYVRLQEIGLKRQSTATLLKEHSRLFPFEGLHGRPDVSFGTSLLQRISNGSFFPCYEKSIRSQTSRIDQNDLAKNRGFQVPEPLWQDVMSVVLLEDSTSAKRHRDAILALPPAQRTQILEALVSLVRFGRGNEEFDLSSETGRRDAMAGARGALSETFGLELPDGIERLPTRTIQAQLTYFEKTVQKHPDMAAGFREYLARVSGEGYETWKDWGAESVAPAERPAALARMKEEGLLPVGVTLPQYEAWVRPGRIEAKEELSFRAEDVASGVRDIVSQAVADGHLSAKTASMSPDLVRQELEQLGMPLREWMVRIQEIDGRFARARIARRSGETPTDEPTEAEKMEYQDLQARVRSYRMDHDRQFRFLAGMLVIDRLKRLSADELRDQVVEIDKRRVPWERAFKDVFEGVVALEPEFQADADRLKRVLEEARAELFGAGRVSRHDLVLDDATDPVALFHVGENPVASCQHWNGGGYLNVGLLSYQTDPNVRMIFMRDEDGALVARAALRLLEGENGLPALLIERVYSANVHPKIKEIFVRLAKQKASDMGVPLYADRGDQIVGEESVTAASPRLQSRGSRSAFVYTDAGGGRARRGIYSVNDAVELYKP